MQLALPLANDPRRGWPTTHAWPRSTFAQDPTWQSPAPTHPQFTPTAEQKTYRCIKVMYSVNHCVDGSGCIGNAMSCISSSRQSGKHAHSAQLLTTNTTVRRVEECARGQVETTMVSEVGMKIGRKLPNSPCTSRQVKYGEKWVKGGGLKSKEK